MSQENNPYREKTKKLRIFCNNCKYYDNGYSAGYKYSSEQCLAVLTEESNYFAEIIKFGNPCEINKNNDCSKFKPTIKFKLFGSKVLSK